MIGTVALLSVLMAAAPQGPNSDPPARREAAPAPSAVATRAAQPPVIDGRDDDAVWRVAPPITGFKEWQPNEGAESKYPTEARIAYDASYVYVFVRAFD